MSQVSDLLAASRRAYRERQEHSGRMHHISKQVLKAPNPSAQEDAITRALDAREEAARLDPDRLDPAWATDLAENRGVTSDAIVAFLTGLVTDTQQHPQLAIARSDRLARAEQGRRQALAQGAKGPIA